MAGGSKATEPVSACLHTRRIDRGEGIVDAVSASLDDRAGMCGQQQVTNADMDLRLERRDA